MKKASWQEEQRNRQGVPGKDHFSALPLNAQRALAREGLDDPHKLAELTEEAVLALQGMVPAALPRLRAWLKAYGLSFKE